MLEQGTGELNVEGAVRLAKLVRTDLLATTLVGSPLLKTSTAPTPQTTLAGQTFTWAQRVNLGYCHASGTNLILKYQGMYAAGSLLSDGVFISEGVIVTDGVFISDGVTSPALRYRRSRLWPAATTNPRGSSFRFRTSPTAGVPGSNSCTTPCTTG